ncbi:carboxypeptidase-like regulatory domain-containing protein, partial [Pedobacter sp.]|uniref:carboxypeptidase-like regulatory domain-containing protein n=1 Tax=Pedobacter sp. TaxID=1411316 RepID=UPI002CD7FED2
MRHFIIAIVLMCCFKATFVRAQTKIKLSGKVTDETNLGIPGATVFSGSPLKSLTATNGSGEFVIMIESEAELVFKSIGFMEYRVKLKPGQTTILVRLKDNSKEMDEVVVRGYVTRSKQLSTGASTT